jgi:16S rRNA (guanine527-N7)-methyltransferase
MKENSVDIQSIAAVIDAHAAEFEIFQRLLLEENAKYNLTRITEPQQIRMRHWLDSLTALPILDELAGRQGGRLKLLDAGSGAGVPGLALAVVRPQWQLVSVEATDKKVHFQQMVCKALKLSNVTVLHDRSESLAHKGDCRGGFDAVTARAVGALPILAELTLAFLRQGGKAVYWKGPDYRSELAEAQTAIEKMGADVEQVQTALLPLSEHETAQTNLVVCTKQKQTPAAYPRVFGLIKKQPLLSKHKDK